MLRSERRSLLAEDKQAAWSWRVRLIADPRARRLFSQQAGGPDDGFA
jgi:hypothetical protein